MNLFGFGKAKPKPTNPAQSTSSANAGDTMQSINKIREEIDLLEKKEEHLLKKIDLFKKGAVPTYAYVLHISIYLFSIDTCAEAQAKMAKKDQKGALLSLKRMKLYENEMNTVSAGRLTLEQSALSLESASTNVHIFNAMKLGNSALKKARGDLDADAVADIVDDMEEERQLQRDISDAITGSANLGLEDDEDLLAELASLEALDVEEKAAAKSVPAKPAARTPAATFNMTLPDAPRHAPALSTEEEDMLRELQANMA